MKMTALNTKQLAAFLILLLLTACGVKEIRTGVYVTNDPANLPLPTDGYRLYFLGEIHGNQQTKSIFISYLKRLYQAGVRDVILEEDQAYEGAANAFVTGTDRDLLPALCLRTDALTLIREFNATRPTGQKVSVHLVDVDSPLSAIHLHLQSLYAQSGAPASVAMPELAEFEMWNSTQMYDLVSALEDAAGENASIQNELETVRDSIQWYFLGNRLETGAAVGSRFVFGPIREKVITQNVRFLLESSEASYMVFFGSAHGMKTQADPNPPRKGFTSWAQRIREAGFPVYSLNVFPLSGDYFWRGVASSYGKNNESTLLADGTSLAELLADSGMSYLYVDLRAAENVNATLPKVFLPIPASEVYDGQIFEVDKTL